MLIVLKYNTLKMSSKKNIETKIIKVNTVKLVGSEEESGLPKFLATANGGRGAIITFHNRAFCYCVDEKFINETGIGMLLDFMTDECYTSAPYQEFMVNRTILWSRLEYGLFSLSRDVIVLTDDNKNKLYFVSAYLIHILHELERNGVKPENYVAPEDSSELEPYFLSDESKQVVLDSVINAAKTHGWWSVGYFYNYNKWNENVKTLESSSAPKFCLTVGDIEKRDRAIQKRGWFFYDKKLDLHRFDDPLTGQEWVAGLLENRNIYFYCPHSVYEEYNLMRGCDVPELVEYQLPDTVRKNFDTLNAKRIAEYNLRSRKLVVQ